MIYAGSLVYKPGTQFPLLESIAFAEGRFYNIDNRYVQPLFFFKDHLGTVDSEWQMTDTPRSLFVSLNIYYPFGHRASAGRKSTLNDRYQFNGKERQTVGELPYTDYGWRMYNPLTGRWNGVDPMAEKYYALSPFNFVNNNPVKYIDPNGMDWYEYTYYKLDREQGLKEQTDYTYLNQTLSKQEMQERGFNKNMGLVASTDKEYLSLNGERISLFEKNQLLNTLESDFNSMDYQAAKKHMNVAESVLNGMQWSTGLKTQIDLNVTHFVVSTSSNQYLNLNNKSLNERFNQQLRENNKHAQFHPVNMGFGGTEMMLIELLTVPGNPKPNYNTKIKNDKRRNQEKLYYYQNSGVIK